MIEEETNSETFEDKRKPNEDLCTPISEEETHAEESNSFKFEVSEKDGSTVINSDSVSGIVRHQTVLKEAEAENKEQVENTDTALDENGLATILTDGTTLDVEGIDEQSDENSNSKEFSESQIPTVAVVDEGEEKVGLGNINLDDAPVNFQVQSLEEAEPTLRVEDVNNNMIAEEVCNIKYDEHMHVTACTQHNYIKTLINLIFLNFFLFLGEASTVGPGL